MKKSIWAGILLGGFVLTALGFDIAGYGGDGAPFNAPLSALSVLFLLTCGILASMFGLIGLSGLMCWIPGLDDNARASHAARVE